MLTKLALGIAGVASASVSLRLPETWNRPLASRSTQDDAFLEELSRASFQFFREFTHPTTGMVKNLGRLHDDHWNSVSSVAATGFGLTSLCIATERGWIKRAEAEELVRKTLQFLWSGTPTAHGFYYHFIDWQSGARVWQSEVSSIDSALLLCGVLSAGEYFRTPEIQDLANRIYDRMDWQWLYRSGPFLSHGWTPENGFLTPCWDTYSEHMMLYLLAIGARENAIPATAWHAWNRPISNYGGGNYIDSGAPIFTHQYSHAWFNFRGVSDGHADYFDNSVTATVAHKKFCTDLRDEFPHYAEDLWGLTASESPQGYVVWGGPPRQGPIDGSIVPCAVSGSLPFLTDNTLATLQNLRARFGRRVWNRLGFVDAFNPVTGWTARDFIAINTGITLLMAENTRSGMVWDLFMQNSAARRGMSLAGFKPTSLV